MELLVLLQDIVGGLFTGYSAAWRLSEEDFIKDLNIFDQLKIRGSWGANG